MKARRGPLLGGMALLGLTVPAVNAQTGVDSVRVLDDFERAGAWSAHPADGVRLAIGGGPGRHGRAMRLDYDFQGHAGYAIARLTLRLELPANYQFSFWIRGRGRPNTLEFKLPPP